MPRIGEVKVKIKDIGVTRSLSSLSPKATAAMIDGVTIGGQIIQKEAIQRIHRVSGFLQDHIIVELQEATPQKAVVAVGTDKKGFYGLFVEMGHRLVRGRKRSEKKEIGYVPPHPFLRPALEASEEEVKKTIAAEIKRRLGL